MFLTNGWGSHSNRLFLANGWPSRSNGWHKRLVDGKPFEKGKSLVYIFPYKVTNIKFHNGCNNKTFRVYNPSSLYEKTVSALHVYSSARIYAILSFNKAEIDSPFGWTVPSWIIPHLSKEVDSYTFALILKLTLVKIICICACYLHKFTIWRAEDFVRSARVWQAALEKRGIRN